MRNSLEKAKRTGGDGDDFAPKVFGFAALGTMAAMLALMNFSMTVIIFLVLVGYFVWRAVTKTETNEVRGIFEFYLAANEILRDDERRWYGFEIGEVIGRGERILSFMPDPPPLVYFTLGALHARAGNHSRADEHLSFVVENEKANENAQFAASSELRSYVRILRKLEREPAEAPQTMAAIRALERSRRHRAAALLDESRKKLKEIAASPAKELSPARQIERNEPLKPLLERLDDYSHGQIAAFPLTNFKSPIADVERKPTNGSAPQSVVGDEKPADDEKIETAKKRKPRTPKPDEDKSHKSITEVLRDIYE